MEIDDRAFVAVFVVILVVGALSVFLVMTAIGDDDPYDVTRNYEVDAVIDGILYSGIGTSEYTPESDSYRIYSFSLTMGSASGDERDMSFGIIFLTDDIPDASIFSFERVEMYGERELSVWSTSYGGAHYTYLIGDMCTVEKVTIETQSGTVTASLTD